MDSSTPTSPSKFTASASSPDHKAGFQVPIHSLALRFLICLGWFFGAMKAKTYAADGLSPISAAGIAEIYSRAENGSAADQYVLGTMFTTGVGLKMNPVEGMRWFYKAAEQGDALAQHMLGLIYDTGKVVQKNDLEAVKWYSKAAEQGCAAAMNYLALHYENGEGIEKNGLFALQLFKKAADQGDANALYNLALKYLNGTGVPMDKNEGLKCMAMSANGGQAQAQCELGLVLISGRSDSSPQGYNLLRKPAEGYKWLLLSAQQGNADARKSITIVKDKWVDADQQAEGLRLAREFEQFFKKNQAATEYARRKAQ